MGASCSKKRYDRTAMAIAKIRLTESMLPPDQRLFTDHFARHFVQGAWIMERISVETIKRKFDERMPGLFSMIEGRTRFLDDLCRDAVENAGCTQMVILGAGYDTRGIRMDLNIPCFELDQPEVHRIKKAKIDQLSKSNEFSVHCISVDFNSETAEKVSEHPQFKKNAKTVVLMEGVTQYIPKESTGRTLRQINNLIGPGSILGFSYVNEAMYSDDPKVVAKEVYEDANAMSKMLNDVRKAGEPWITGWSNGGNTISEFLQEYSWREIENVTIADLEELYFTPIGRTAAPFLRAEHFVKAEFSI